MAIQPRSESGEASPSEAGRFSRSLAQSGVDVGTNLVAAEAALDERLRAALMAYGRLKQQVEFDLPHLDDLLLCDEESPAAAQLADMISAARQMGQLLSAQARATADLMVLLREAAAAARSLGDQAELLRVRGAGARPSRPKRAK